MRGLQEPLRQAGPMSEADVLAVPRGTGPGAATPPVIAQRVQ